jgi:hypothetical protein
MADSKNRRDDAGPSEAKREAQDRESGAQAQSPNDKLHVDAPKQQDNARGHKTIPQGKEARTAKGSSGKPRPGNREKDPKRTERWE